MDRKQRLDAELAILGKGRWGVSEVMGYYQVSKHKAYSIIAMARANGGIPKYGMAKEALADKIIEIQDESTVLKEIEKRALERRHLK